MSEVERLTASLADRYRVEREIGRGGMATVYLAHDVRHDRDVAIKVLHADLGAALGGERFLAEIKTTAKLQHPHILPLLDSGTADGLLFYVMPMVTGESLRARLDREGQLPIEDAVRIAREVADALGAAHAQGIIHRDIKPENILLQGGHALVADFGIALAVQQAGGERMTQTGLSLGTPQYMSPEQAMGEKHVDARTDIYALAAVTYEMLAGEAPFTGPSVQAIVARVLTEEPRALSVQRKTISAGLEYAVMQGLEKLPADRHSSATDFSRALDAERSPGTTHAALSAARVRRSPKRFLPWGVAVLMAIAATAAVATREGRERDSILVTTILPPEGQAFSEGASFGTLSPNGRVFAFAALNARGESQLWVRRLDTLFARPLRSTDRAQLPFFSPDGVMLGYFVGDQAFVVEASGGVPRPLCTVVGATGGTWGAHNVIALTGSDGVYRANAATGECHVAIKADRAWGGHPEHPSLLDDGRHVLFSPPGVGAENVRAGDLDAGTSRVIIEHAQDATFVAPDLIVFGRGSADGSTNTLWAQRFDPRGVTLRGQPVVISSEVRSAAAIFAYAVSESGDLTYLPGRPDLGELITDRAGHVLDTVSSPGTWTFQWAHSHPWIADAGGRGLVIFDVRKPVAQPVRSTAGAVSPAWSPRDTAIAYMTCDTLARCAISVAHLGDGHVNALFADSSGTFWPTSWSSDARHLLLTRSAEFMYRRGEIWEYDFATKKLSSVLAETFGVAEGAVSPDGRWLAYRSDETGNSEVWMRPFLRPGAPKRISSGGGRSPRWQDDGRELYFESPDGRLMHVAIGGGAELGALEPHALFAVPEWTRQTFSDQWGTSYDVSGDGQRFALRMSAATNAAVFVHGWTRLIKR